MKTKLSRNIAKNIFFTICFILSFGKIFGEGSKELLVNSAGNYDSSSATGGRAGLQIWDNSSFTPRISGTYNTISNANDIYRIKIKICNVNEMINLGFLLTHGSTTDVDLAFRLYKPDGTTVPLHANGFVNGLTQIGVTTDAVYTYRVPRLGEPGFIRYFSQAFVGPWKDQVTPKTGPVNGVGTFAGYRPIQHEITSIADTGTYFIVFQDGSFPDAMPNTTRKDIALFDITVFDNSALANRNPILGRLHCAAWDMTLRSFSNPLNARFFFYSNDGVITSVKFNSLQPYSFILTANAKGCTATGNIAQDRKSRQGNINYPEFPIFLNNPQNTCGFSPRGAFPSLVGTINVTGCDDDRCINLTMDQTTKVGATLLFPGTSFVPRTLNDITAPANTQVCIPWDGKDGAGNKITGIPFNIRVNSYNGLTNLPLYDVENNRNGYDIQLVAPSAAAGATPIMVYWDDVPPSTDAITTFNQGKSLDGFVPATNAAITYVPGFVGSSYNLVGCDPSIDNAAGVAGKQGCHLWENRGENSNMSDGCANQPNCPETMNTWWNANILDITTSFTPGNVTVVADVKTPVPTGVLNEMATKKSITVCSNLTSIDLDGTVAGDVTTGTWTIISGGDGTFTTSGGSLTDVDPRYTFGNTDLTTKKVILRLTSAVAPCGTAYDTLTINIQDGPSVTAGPNQTVCKNNPFVTLAGSKNAATSIVQWSSSVAGGIFVPDAQTLNAVYQPPVAITSAAGTSNITLTLSSISNTGVVQCPAATSTTVITYTSSPVVALGNDVSICAASSGATTHNLNATINGGNSTAGFTLAWSSTTGGAFTNNTTLAPTYTFTNVDLLSKKATIILSVTQATPACAATTDTIVINIVDNPIATAPADFSACETTSSISLSGGVVNATFSAWTVSPAAAGTITSTGSGTATFTRDPSISKITSPLTFTLTATKANCPTSTDLVVVSPSAQITAPQTSNFFCKTAGSSCLNLSINLSGTAAGITTTWTPLGAINGPITPINESSALYCLSNSDKNLNILQIKFTINTPGCAPYFDTVKYVARNETINAINASVCDASPGSTILSIPNANVTTSRTGGSFLWQSLSSTPGSFAPANAKITSYTLSGKEVSDKTTNLSISWNINGCTYIDTMTVTVNTTPTVSVGNNSSGNCRFTGAAARAITLIATSSTNSGTWTASGHTGTFANDNALNTTFTPTVAGLKAVNTITFTFTSTNACGTSSASFDYNYVPPHAVDAGPAVLAVCANNATISLNGTGNTTGAQWTSTGTGTWFPNANKAITTYIPSADDITSGSIDLTLTSTGTGSCPDDIASDKMTVTFSPVPTVTPGTYTPVCANNATFTLNASVTNATGGSWASSSGCVSCFSSSTALNATYTPSAQDITNGTVTLTLTSTGNGPCLAAQATTTLTINRAPTIVAGADQVVCTNNNSTAITAVATNQSSVAWAITTGSGSVAAPASLNTTYNISATDKTNGVVILTVTANGNTGCNPVTDQVQISFTDFPSVNAGPSKTVCLNDVPVLLDGSGSAGATWSCATCTGSIANPALLRTTYSPGVGESGVTRTFTLGVAASGGCPAVSSTVNITINPAPTITQANTYSLCANNASVAISANPSTTSGVWTSTGTGSFANQSANTTSYAPSADDITAGNVILTFTTTNNGFCSAVSDTAKLFISPTLTVNAGPAQNICATPNSTITLNGSVLIGNSTPGTGTWSIVAGGGTINTPASLTSTYTLPAAVLPPNTITLRLTASNGLCANVTSDVIYTLVAAPTVTITAPVGGSTICDNATNITLSGTITGTPSGTWTVSDPTTGTFSPNNVFNAAQTSVNFIPSATIGNNASIVFTLSADPNICGNAVNATTTVNIDNKPIVSAGNDATICANNNVISLASASITNAATGTWTSIGAGTFAPSNAFPGTTSYDADTNDIARGFVTLTLTSAANGACTATSDQVIYTFTDAPVVNAGPDLTVCANNNIVDIAGSVNSPFTTTWATTAGINTAFADPTDLATTYTLTNADTTAGSVTLVLSSVDPAGSCATDRDSLTITITDAPIVNAGNDLTLCGDNPRVLLNADANISADIDGTWTSSSTTGGFFTPDALDDTTFYVPSPTERLGTTVTLTFTTQDGYCKPVSDQLTLTVTAVPTISITNGDSIDICANAGTVALSATFDNTKATGIIWTTTGQGNIAANTATNTNYTLDNDDISAGTVIFTARTTGNLNGCSAAFDVLKVKIQQLPVVNAGPDFTICQTQTSLSLTAATITNANSAVWSSSGSGTFSIDTNFVSANNTYFPSRCCQTTLDTAQNSIMLFLTSTNNNLCPADKDTLVINFTKTPIAGAGADQTVCANTAGVNLTASVARNNGVTWASLGTGTFSPNTNSNTPTYRPTSADTTAGSVKIILTANGQGNCAPVTDTLTLTFQDLPLVDLGLDFPICAIGEDPDLRIEISNVGLYSSTSINYSTPGTGTLDVTNILKPVYYPSADDINAGQVTLNATTVSGVCSGAFDNVVISIQKSPTININPAINVCANTGATITLNAQIANAIGGVWTSNGTGAFDDDNSLTPIYTPTATEDDAGNTTTFTFTATSGTSCTNVIASTSVTFGANPPFDAGRDTNICFITDSDVIPIPVNAGIAGTWTANPPASGNFTPSATGTLITFTPVSNNTALFDNNVITLTIDPTDPCYIGTASLTITLRQGPSFQINPASVANICENSANPVLMLQNVIASTTVNWSVLQGSGSLATIGNPAVAATYAIGANDRNITDISIKIAADGIAACNTYEDTINFKVFRAPTVNASSDITLCSDATTFSLSGDSTNTTSVNWSIVSGGGSITSAASSINLTYAITGPTDFPITLQLTADGPTTPCANEFDQVTISSIAAPVIDLQDAAIDMCVGLNPLNLNATIVSNTAASVVWSIEPPHNAAPNGTFLPNSNTVAAQYVPVAADTLAGTLSFRLTATNTGICANTYSDVVTYNFDPQPVMNAGPNLTFCAQNKFILISGDQTGADDGYEWGTFGTGTFMPQTNSTTTVYTVSPADSTNGGAILWLKSNNGATVSCPDDTAFMSISLNPAPVTVVDAGADRNICEDNIGVQLGGLIINATGGTWERVGLAPGQSAGSFNDATKLSPFYTFSPDDMTEDTIIIRLISVGHDILCQPSVDTVMVFRTPTPDISVTINAPICPEATSIPITGAIAGSAINNGQWTSVGDGVFAPNAFAMNPTYKPGPSDITSGNISIILTANKTATNCVNTYSKDTTLPIIKAVVADAGLDTAMCLNNALISLQGQTSSNAGSWSIVSTDGSLNNLANFNTEFTPGATDITNGAAILKFTANSSNAACASDSDLVAVKFSPAPIVTAMPDQTICIDVAASGGFTVTGDITVSGSGIWTVAAGAGTISASTVTTIGNIKRVSAIYTPADTADVTSGNVLLVLTSLSNTSTNNALCQAEDDTVSIDIMPKPTVDVASASTCVMFNGVAITGSVSHHPTYYPNAFGQWSTSGSGSFSTDLFDSSATYVPSAADIIAQEVTLTWTSVGAGTCQPIARDITMNVSTPPSVSAGADLFTCNGANVTLTAQNPVASSKYIWNDISAGPATLLDTANTYQVSAAGTYQLNIVDRLGCTNADTVIVNGVTVPTASTPLNPTDCYDYYLALQINSNPTGIAALGTFQWFFNNRLMEGKNNDSVRVTQPGIYTLTYTLGACTNSFGSTDVKDIPLTSTPDVIGCENSTVSASVNLIKNTTAPYTYNWFTDNAYSIAETTGNPGTLNTANTSIDSTYHYVRVTDGNNCTHDDSTLVISLPRPNPALPSDTQACENSTIVLDATRAPSNYNTLIPYSPTIEWYASGSPTSILSTATTLSVNTSNTYVIKITVGQCSEDDTSIINFRPYPVSPMNSEYTQCFETVPSLTLDAGTGSASATSVTYDWNGPNTSVASTTRTFVVNAGFFGSAEQLTYTVQITNNFNALACAITDTVLVNDVCSPRIFVPTAFNPNHSDPENQTWGVKGKYVDEFEIWIYSRWGEVIYHSTDVNQTWDGKFKGEFMPPGAYPAIINYKSKEAANPGPFKKEIKVVLIR